MTSRAEMNDTSSAGAGPVVLLAPDKFRGTATARQVCAALGQAVRARDGRAIDFPLSDGGEGMLEAFGGANRVTRVSGPLGDPVDAPWRLDDDGRAVIETAAACGLELVGGAVGNDPGAATTTGVGELIAEALEAGATRILLGLGGSATTDGGEGAVTALENAGLAGRFAATSVLVCCDVQTRFTDAAAVYGPQKGADTDAVRELTGRLHRLRRWYLEHYGLDPQLTRGSGAAGGLAGGLAVLGARLVPGLDVIAAEAGLDSALAAGGLDLVVTGEGRFDRTSLAGKVVGGVARRALAAGVPVLAVVGEADPQVLLPGLTVRALVDTVGRERALLDTQVALSEVLGTHLDWIAASRSFGESGPLVVPG